MALSILIIKRNFTCIYGKYSFINTHSNTDKLTIKSIIDKFKVYHRISLSKTNYITEVAHRKNIIRQLLRFLVLDFKCTQIYNEKFSFRVLFWFNTLARKGRKSILLFTEEIIDRISFEFWWVNILMLK